MKSAKRFVSRAIVCVALILAASLVSGGMDRVMAGDAPKILDVRVSNPTSEPVPVAQQGPVEVVGTVGLYDNTVMIDSTNPVSVVSQGTTSVSGSVEVSNWPTTALPVAQQGQVEVFGTVGLSDNTFGIDPSANTVTIGSGSSMDVSGTVGIHPDANIVRIGAGSSTAVSGTVTVTGTVGIHPDANTVRIDSSTPVAVVPQGTTNVAGSVTVSNPNSSPVPVSQVGTLNVAGTVGLATYQNTVKLDPANNTVQVTNPTGQALDVNIVGGSAGEAAIQPVHFKSTYNTNFTWVTAYTVPAGKILKIEYVSVYAEADDLWPVVSMKTTVGGVESEYWLPRLEAEWVQQEGNATAIFGRGHYRMSTQVTIYADEGTVVQSAGRCAFTSCGNPSFLVTFAGTLMDK